jgi:hypothetical protein
MAEIENAHTENSGISLFDSANRAGAMTGYAPVWGRRIPRMANEQLEIARYGIAKLILD